MCFKTAILKHKIVAIYFELNTKIFKIFSMVTTMFYRCKKLNKIVKK